MSVPRLPMLSDEDALARAAEVGVSDAAAGLNVYKVWLNQPDVAKWIDGLLMGLLWNSSFDTRLRELIIMRLGWTTGSVYEWTQHWGIASSWLDVAEEDLFAVQDWEHSDRFGPAERAVMAAVDDVVRDGSISADTFEQCRTHVSADPAVLVEMTMTVGTWRMISTVLQSLEVPLEDGVMPWPPEGRGPMEPPEAHGPHEGSQ